jgi:hypothetical protein
MKLRVVESGRLPGDERRQRWRQVFLARQGGALHEHRDHPDAAAQGGLDFEADEVVRIVEPAGAVRRELGYPSGTDHHEHRRGLAKRRLQDLHEVGAGLDGVDVEEHAIRTEAPLQMVGEPAGIARRVVSPVADEDALGHEDRARPMIRRSIGI